MKSGLDRLVWLTLGVCIGAILTAGGMGLMNRTQPAPIYIEPPPPTATAVPTATPSPMRVHVTGAVSDPAVYTLPPGAIVEEAIAAAGGFRNGADTAVVNLAQPLADGAQVYVPMEGEAVRTAPDVVTNPTPASVSPAGSGAASGGLINLNTASLAELDTLPGIGPSTAQKILDYRETNGSFATIEAIMEVSGIGEAKYEAIKELVTVGDG